MEFKAQKYKDYLIKQGYSVQKSTSRPAWRSNNKVHLGYIFAWVSIYIVWMYPEFLVEAFFEDSKVSTHGRFFLSLSLSGILISIYFASFGSRGLLGRIIGVLFFPIKFLIYLLPSLFFEKLRLAYRIYRRIPLYPFMLSSVCFSLLIAEYSSRHLFLEISQIVLYAGAFLSTYAAFQWVSSPYGWIDRVGKYINKLSQALMSDLLSKASTLTPDSQSIEKVKPIVNVLDLFDIGNKFARKLASQKLLLILFLAVTGTSLLINFSLLSVIALIHMKLGGMPVGNVSFFDMIIDITHYFFGHDGRFITSGAFPSGFLIFIYFLNFVYLVLLMTSFGSLTTSAADKTKTYLDLEIEKSRVELKKKVFELSTLVSKEVSELMHSEPTIRVVLIENSDEANKDIRQ